MAALGLRCCSPTFSRCSKSGLLSGFNVHFFSLWWLLLLQSTGTRVHGGLQSEDSVVTHRLSCMWDLPGPAIKPMFPGLASGLLTTRPLGKSQSFCFGCRDMLQPTLGTPQGNHQEESDWGIEFIISWSSSAC